MTAADDATTCLAKDFTLEIHVGQLNGGETKIISYTWEKGREDYTMGRVLLQALYMYPAPVNSRPRLTLCGRVLDAESKDMNMRVRAYLDLYCDDYKKKPAKLQMDATLIFERDAGLHPPGVARACVEAKVGSWWRTMSATWRGRCTGYSDPPEARPAGRFLGEIPADTYIGPVTKVKVSARYVTIFVKGWWIDVWERTTIKGLGTRFAKQVTETERQAWTDRGWRDAGLHPPLVARAAVARAAPEAKIGSWWRTMPAPWIIRCEGYSEPPGTKHAGRCLGTIPADTYIGPVTKVKVSARHVTILVKGWWIDVWERTNEEGLGTYFATQVSETERQAWRDRGWRDAPCCHADIPAGEN